MAADDEQGKQPNLFPVSDALKEVLRSKLSQFVPEPKKHEVTRVIHEVVASFQGPLPPPAILRGYEDIIPGVAERIIGWPKGSRPTGIPGSNGL
jgi:hypothetical protein